MYHQGMISKSKEERSRGEVMLPFGSYAAKGSAAEGNNVEKKEGRWRGTGWGP